MPSLFDPIQYGAIKASNRLLMAPMTRARATREHVPTEMMVEYYAQRADVGVIISEAVGISQQGLGMPFAPGLWNQAQVDAWKPVTAGVHAKGGKIVAQLWHMGRAAHSNVTGQQPVSSSETKYPHQLHTYAGKLDPETSRSLSVEDIQSIVKDYAIAAKNAIAAGFDGIQIHGANGYLIDQFLRDSANKRTDSYGGSYENRTRLLEEVVKAIVDAIGANRTSLRLSPNGDTQGVDDSNPQALFPVVIEMLNKHNLAFLELREIGPNDTFGKTEVPKLHGLFRKLYKGTLVLNQEYDAAAAEKDVAEGTADAIAIGRPFIANADLVQKIKNKDTNWAQSDVSTWYSQGAKGYLDYPTTKL